MINWISSNMATIIVCIVLVAIFAAIIRYLIINRKKGNTFCGCHCPGCKGHCNENK